MKVSNVSLGALEQDIKEFFSFSGDIEYVEMMRLVLVMENIFILLSSSVSFPSKPCFEIGKNLPFENLKAVDTILAPCWCLL